MRMQLSREEVQLTLSKDEFMMIRAALGELHQAVNEHDCFLRTGYEMSDFEPLREAFIAVKHKFFDEL